MKFVKGAAFGAATAAVAMMIYKDMNQSNKNKMIKKGKQFAKKIGVM